MLFQQATSFSSSNESSVINVFCVFFFLMYASHSIMSKVSSVQGMTEPSHPSPTEGHPQSLSGIRDLHSVIANSYMAES